MPTSYATAISLLAPVVDNGVGNSDPRVQKRIDEAQRRLILQRNYYAHREESLLTPLTWQEGGTTGNIATADLILDDIDSTKLMILAAFREENNSLEMATQLESKAFAYVQRNVIGEVEKSRYDELSTLALLPQGTFGGLIGKLGLETFNKYQMPVSRLKSYINQAYEQAVDHYNYLVRKEQNDLEPVTFTALTSNSATFSNSSITIDILRSLSLILIQQNAQPGNDVVGENNLLTLKNSVFQLLEKNVSTAVQTARKNYPGDIGRLHNEVSNGLTISSARMGIYLNQAITEIDAHRAFVQRREDYNGILPVITYEEKKIFVSTYLFSLNDFNASDATGMTVSEQLVLGEKKDQFDVTRKQMAYTLIERNVMAYIESGRRIHRQELQKSDPRTFGYHWSRVALDLPAAYAMSDNAVKRAVNSAEEILMRSGKWVGTLGTYVLDVTESGETFLPQEVETILFASFDSNQQPVFDRFNEWMRGGSGLRTDDHPWRNGFVDRGDCIDPADGKIKRKYFVSYPDGSPDAPIVTILAKKRFIPHLADTSPMFLDNYSAIALLSTGILSNSGEGALESAQKLLSSQVSQQYFVARMGGAHNRKLATFR
jgi:hypothetical protein